MKEQFYTTLTAIGKAKIANATALGNKVNFTTLKIGDSNGKYYNPTESQEDLVNTLWEGNINSISVDEKNPNWIVIEVIIPSNVGGFVIREAGIFDDEGDLIAIGKYPETYKPKAEDGSTKDLIIKMILEVNNNSSITLKVDPTVILASKKDIEVLEDKIQNIKVPVTSVNSKTGEVKLKAEDIKTNSGETVELQLADMTQQIENIDLSADKVSINSTVLNSKNVKAGLEELFTFADNYKKAVANVIGKPVTNQDTAEQMKVKVQNMKVGMVTIMKELGQTSSANKTLQELIEEIYLEISSLLKKGESVTGQLELMFPVIENSIGYRDPSFTNIGAVEYNADGSEIYIYVRDRGYTDQVHVLNPALGIVKTLSGTSSLGNRPVIKNGKWFGMSDHYIYVLNLNDFSLIKQIKAGYSSSSRYCVKDFKVFDNGEDIVAAYANANTPAIGKFNINGSKIWETESNAVGSGSYKDTFEMVEYDEKNKSIFTYLSRYDSSNPNLIYCFDLDGNIKWSVETSRRDDYCLFSNGTYLYTFNGKVLRKFSVNGGGLIKEHSYPGFSTGSYNYNFLTLDREKEIIYFRDSTGWNLQQWCALDLKNEQVYTQRVTDRYISQSGILTKEIGSNSNFYAVDSMSQGSSTYGGVFKLSRRPKNMIAKLI